ncbi:MAG TPA: MMPL family transporter [Actinomycetes bacterium]|nr:MMPL family transporter [Actinomycetes bacterium]
MFFTRLARFTYTHRRAVIAAWVLVFLTGIVLGGGVFGRLVADGPGRAPGSESDLARRRLAALSPDGPELYAVADGRPVDDLRLAASLARASATIRALPGVARVVERATTPAPQLTATDGRAALLVVELRRGQDDDEEERTADAAVRALRAIDAPRVIVGGGLVQDGEFEEQSKADLEKAELLSLPVVLVLLLVVFAGVVAAGLPLLVALVGISGTLLILFGVSQLTDVSVYAVNVVTMLGLGLAIDYGLLVVSRFREERQAAPGADPARVVEATMATAGRTVAVSGLTVAASLGGLLVFDDPFLRSMGYGGMGVVVVDLLAAVTLLPALLACWGARIRPARARRTDRGLFVSLSRLVQRRAGLIVATVAAGLALLALPFAGARYENPDARSLPRGSESRELAELVTARFPGGTGTEPVVAVADTFPDSPAVRAWAGQLRALPGAERVAVRPGPAPGLTIAELTPAGTSQGRTATTLVGQVRHLQPGFPVAVTGDAALLVDYKESLAHRLPASVALIVLVTFVLLFTFTGSVVVPAKAIVMNVLSLGASFGALVWVFQDGHLAWLLGVDSTGTLDLITPLLVFAIAFGLSMDYEVFLLSRIGEAWEETGDNDLAVAFGLQRTGRIVTAAALLIVVVFAAFMTGGLATIKQIGLGMTLAVALDATVVRMLLVPATMKLAGRWNWWAPAPLRRLHDRFGLREATTPPTAEATTPPAAEATTPPAAETTGAAPAIDNLVEGAASAEETNAAETTGA